WKDYQYENAKDCAKCHRTPDPESSQELVLLAEYSIWKTHDKHAQAYAVLTGVRGRRMAEILQQDVTKPETGCLNCHGMDKINKENKAKGAPADLDNNDGISCGICHGPSSKWGGDMHSRPAMKWRERQPDDKFKQGMRDLRDPAVRAELCMS